MGIRRFSTAAAAVSGVTLAGLAASPAVSPAMAGSSAPKPTITMSPEPFEPGDKVNLRVTGCSTEPKAGKPNQIFAEGEPKSFDGVGGVDWTASGATRLDLLPGGTYVTRFTCATGQVDETFELTTTLPKTPTPTPTPTPTKEQFSFGFDDVELSTHTVNPSGKITMTVTCPTKVRATSAAFVSEPAFERATKTAFKATGEFKKDLPAVVKIKIGCADHGSVTFSTKPGDDTVSKGDNKIPSGAPDTGDGSTAGRGPASAALLASGSAAVVAGAGLAGLALRRRTRKSH